MKQKYFTKMKKIIIVLAALFVVGSTNLFAQKTEKKADAKKEAPAKKEDKESATKMKKDGTPDKRYKENKEEKQHLKKDGTPDKRFNDSKK